VVEPGSPVLGAGEDGQPRGPWRPCVWLLVALVGLAFADTSIVALALPQLYGEFDTSIVTVSWVLTGYAVAVTLVGFGLAVAHRWVRPAVLVGVGLAVLAVTCVGTGLARSLPILLGSRCGQGVGAALVLTGAVPVLAEVLGSRAGRLTWIRAAALGLAAGPALGGVLTQLFDWRAIFLAQVPAAMIGLLVLADRRIRAAPASAGPPSPGAGPVLGLTLLSGGLVGALFLSVLLVIEVWRLTPLAGAGVVSALPAGMVLAQPVARRLVTGSLVAAGVVALSGGLVALALLPAATAPWAMVALLVCGVGWALLDEVFEVAPITEAPLTEAPLTEAPFTEEGVVPRYHRPGGEGVRAGGISTGARHAGLVVGLVLIAPVLAGALEQASERAALTGTAIVLDARLSLPDKVKVAGALRDGLAASDRGQVPDVAGLVGRSAGRAPAAHELGEQLRTRLRDILTRAFRPSFGIAAALAACTLLPGVIVVWRQRRRATRAATDDVGATAAAPTLRLPLTTRVLPAPAQLLVAAMVPALTGVLLFTQLGVGAAQFGTATQTDPCRAAPDPYPGSGWDALEQRLILSTLNGAACSLGVSRESLVLSLDGRSRFGTAGLAPGQVEPALRAGLIRAIDDAQRRGDLPDIAALALRQVTGRVPLAWLASRLGLPTPGRGDEQAPKGLPR
jgi:hypothetical protein